MTDSEAVLPQEFRRRHDVPCCVAPPGFCEDIIIHGLDAQFDTGQAIALQALQDSRRNAVRPGRTADSVDGTGHKGFMRRLQQAFLDLYGNSRETAAIEGHFPAARRPGRSRIRGNEAAHLIRRRNPSMPGNLPLITKDTAMRTADMRNENRDNRRLHEASCKKKGAVA